MFENLSNLSQGVNTAFVVILSICFFFLIGLTILIIVFIYRYHAKKHPVADQIEGNSKLEVLWTVIPILIVIAMFYYGWIGWTPLYSNAPKNAIPIKTVGRMWNWRFEYENGKKTDTLYIPQGKPVVLDLVSVDVIHSFYIPAFRVKMDMIPGKEMKVWFVGNAPGSYDIFCAEFCGLQHSSMFTAVKVLPRINTTNGILTPRQSPCGTCRSCSNPGHGRRKGLPFNWLYGLSLHRRISNDGTHIQRCVRP